MRPQTDDFEGPDAGREAGRPYESGARGPSTRAADGPLICVAPNWLLSKPHAVHAPNESVPSVFMDAIIAAGGCPVMMPTTEEPELIARFVRGCDGFAIPGGPGVDPQLWGERQLGGWPCPERDRLELELVSQVAEADKPLLAICRGMQLVNVWRGGSLMQNLGDAGQDGEELIARHHQTPQAMVHEVDVREGTKLASIVGAGPHRANSNHRMAVRVVGDGLIVSATAPDGVVEAVELPDRRFFLGLQWHPEYTWTFNEPDRLIWRSFVRAAAG